MPLETCVPMYANAVLIETLGHPGAQKESGNFSTTQICLCHWVRWWKSCASISRDLSSKHNGKGVRLQSYILSTEYDRSESRNEILDPVTTNATLHWKIYPQPPRLPRSSLSRRCCWNCRAESGPVRLDLLQSLSENVKTSATHVLRWNTKNGPRKMATKTLWL